MKKIFLDKDISKCLVYAQYIKVLCRSTLLFYGVVAYTKPNERQRDASVCLSVCAWSVGTAELMSAAGIAGQGSVKVKAKG